MVIENSNKKSEGKKSNQEAKFTRVQWLFFPPKQANFKANLICVAKMLLNFFSIQLG